MSREEDDAVALVRVYCGLASADPAEPQSGSDIWLTVAVVDDAGRLIDICEVSDDAGGYAELSALLAQRSGGQSAVAVAAESDDHVVTQLLTAAGRTLAFTDDDSADDYAERFADDESPEEIQSNAAERRAVGLARALQAGVLSAVGQSPPRDMLPLKPVLAAHAAVVAGRQSAAATLREVLRELYPAALRAYPDPAEAIPLAILDALPEPGILGGGAAGRNRDAQVVADLAATGVADADTLGEAITALRVAIAETPRRTGVNRALTTAVAETIRQSVAAVRASDAAAAALVGVLADKMNPVGRTTRQRPATPLSPATPLRAAAEATPARSARAATAATAAPAATAETGKHGSRATVPAAPAAPAASAERSRAASRAAEVARAEESAASRAVGGRRRAQPAPAQAQPPVVSAPPAAVVSSPPGLTTSPVISTPPGYTPAAASVTSAPPVTSTPPGYTPAPYTPPTPTYAPAPPIPPTFQQQPVPASMQSIPVPLQGPPPQPKPVAPLPVAPAPVAPPPVAPEPVIPPPTATEPQFTSLMPPPPPGIAPLIGGHEPAEPPRFETSYGYDPLAPAASTSAPPAASVTSVPPVDTGAMRLSDLSSLGEPPVLDPVAQASGARSGWPLNGSEPPSDKSFSFSDPLAPSSELSSLPRLSDIPAPPAELDLDRSPDLGLGRSADLGRSEVLSRAELSRGRSRSERSRSAELDEQPTRSESRRAERSRAEAVEAEPARSERARTELPRSERSRTEAPRTETETSRTEIPRSERSRSEIPRSERSRSERSAERQPERPSERTDERQVELPRQREGRVPPPWQTGDLPAEPAGLRLVEPAPVPDPALASGYTGELSGDYSGEFRFEPPALRLVEPSAERATARSSGSGAGRSRRAAAERAEAAAKPTDDGDGDLLIFAAARSAWFTDWDSDTETSTERPAVNWENSNDSAWQAAQRASAPEVVEETHSGLPRRVPQQNLVPGAPVNAPERPLRIVRDAAQIAAHTTGYFRGWRRGQEVGGFAVGGRPGRESAGGWDFSRDAGRDYQEREYEYRSARR
ncbi:hypothetical protein ACFFX1_05540 [Dactylosporangium sucinum]|uniref:Transposase n=1 Tax=Dactylosporangium sucinum TaxID=1424081 RepID=A0A917TPM6_9ACTN|nr:hypothetical protein [Dactylosporangium sucinum]GGM32111.1 hypothetical protein GCM10007977_036650 [Dactylosporangium sucinum]